MVKRETYLRELRKQLYELYFEIAFLQKRLEEASANIQDECYGPVKSLANHYQSLETTIETFRKSQEEPGEERFTAFESSLEELQQNVTSTGRWAWYKMSSQASPFGSNAQYM